MHIKGGVQTVTQWIQHQSSNERFRNQLRHGTSDGTGGTASELAHRDICILNGRSMTGDNGELTEPAGQRTRNYLNSLIHWRIDPPQIKFRTRDAKM